MELLCVRTKPRHSKGKHSRKESPAIRIEARPGDPGKEKYAGPTCRMFSPVSHSYPDPSHMESEASDREHRHSCACGYCYLEELRPPTSNRRQSEGLAGRQGPRERIRGNPQQIARVDQIYVHPYSTHHYRFPVVNHSATCRGSRPAALPVCYMALVPEAATVRDIEAALAPHLGLVAMVRLLSTEEPVHISTFHSIKALHEASMQLEVWDSEKEGSHT
ncbi:hypothetical protein F4861DRAFT_21347 [Xylaria intraflava]|nr:hypothetical protein F4861DRAFT_21347 [Xylaria intraflava]